MNIFKRIKKLYKNHKIRKQLINRMKEYQNMSIKERLDSIPAIKLQKVMKKICDDADNHLSEIKKDSSSYLSLYNSKYIH